MANETRFVLVAYATKKQVAFATTEFPVCSGGVLVAFRGGPLMGSPQTPSMPTNCHLAIEG